MTQRILPTNLEAEESVIGSLLIDGDAINTLSVNYLQFFNEPCRILYKTCQQLNSKGVSINQITVAEELDRDGNLEKIGGVAYLSHLIAMVPTSLDIEYYADIVSKLATFRGLVVLGNDIQTLGFAANIETQDALDQVDRLLTNLRKASNSSAAVISPEDRFKKQFDRYMEMANQAKSLAVPTGLIDLDYGIGGGFYPGEMIILAARPGVGKTTLVQNFTTNMARKGPVLFVSSEMTVDSLTDREIAAELGIPINQIRQGQYTEQVQDGIIQALGKLSQDNQVHFLEKSPITTGSIKQSALELQLRKGLSAIVIDYLGLLDDDIGKNSYERVGGISRKLKQIAKSLMVPVIVIHQLNRASEWRQEHRPQLSDLRDAGNLEQDADVVMFIYRDDYYFKKDDWEREFPDKPYPEGIVELIIAKQRQGSSFVVSTRYDKEHQRYQNLTR